MGQQSGDVEHDLSVSELSVYTVFPGCVSCVKMGAE